MDGYGETTDPETFNPWSVVNLVFHHLVSEGLHPGLGEDPGKPAADLLRAFGITPAAEGSRQASEQTKRDLEKIRATFDQELSRKPLASTGLEARPSGRCEATARATAGILDNRHARRKHCLISRAHDLGFRVVMQHTRTFGAVGCSP